MTETSPYDYDERPYNFKTGNGRKRRPRSSMFVAFRAALDENFLCETGVPEIDALRDEHVALVRELKTLGRAASTLKHSYEAEDKEYRLAIRQGEADDFERTPRAVREENLEKLDLQIEAAGERCLAHVQRISETVQGTRVSWRSMVKSAAVDAHNKRVEAERMQAEAWSEQMKAQRLYNFLSRIDHGDVRNFLVGGHLLNEPVGPEPKHGTVPSGHPGEPIFSELESL